MLKDTHSHLILEIHPNKNEGLDVSKLHTHSNKKIWWQCSKGHEWQAKINDRSKGHNCHYCSNQKACKDNCLANKFPNLIKEWSDKNSISPFEVLPGSKKKVWWKCNKGHEWNASINKRTIGRGCHVCSNKIIIPSRSLQELNQELCKQWNYGKNIISPITISPCSSYKAWWICEKQHEWEATVINRHRLKRGCPYCMGRKCSKENSLALYFPHLINQWHPTKNHSLNPFTVTKGSNRKIHWVCSKGHEWMASIYNRTIGTNCPRCFKISKTQKFILEIIEKKFPHYKIESNFKNNDLRFLSNRKMELDIFIPHINLAIEYQGEFHFMNIMGEKELKACQQRDKEKKIACKKHGIKLIEINYNDPINEEYIYSLIKDYV